MNVANEDIGFWKAFIAFLNKCYSEEDYAVWWCIMLVYSELSALPGAFVGSILRFFGFEPSIIAWCGLVTFVTGVVILLFRKE